MANLRGSDGTVLGIQEKEYGTTQLHALGTIGLTPDNRRFRYCKAGGTALVVGDAIQSPAIVPDHLERTAAATAIGSSTVAVPLGATLAAANQYAEGYLGISVTPDLGHAYRISGHPAAALSTTLTVTLDPSDLVGVAFTTATRLNLIANPYNGVIQFPVTTATGILVGVAVSTIAASSYGWIQTHGIGFPLIHGTPALGAYVMSPGTTAGGSVIITTTNLIVAQLLGRMAMVGVNAKCGAVMLDID